MATGGPTPKCQGKRNLVGERESRGSAQSQCYCLKNNAQVGTTGNQERDHGTRPMIEATLDDLSRKCTHVQHGGWPTGIFRRLETSSKVIQLASRLKVMLQTGLLMALPQTPRTLPSVLKLLPPPWPLFGSSHFFLSPATGGTQITTLPSTVRKAMEVVSGISSFWWGSGSASRCWGFPRHRKGVSSWATRNTNVILALETMDYVFTFIMGLDLCPERCRCQQNFGYECSANIHSRVSYTSQVHLQH